jgi:hypothetical protein
LQKTFEGFLKLFFTYIKIGRTYIIKLQPHCYVRDGFFGYGGDQLEYPLRTFESIGVMGSLVLAHCYYGYSIQDEDLRRAYLQQAEVISDTLAALIENNPAAHNPQYDGHAIDIVLGLLALRSGNSIDVATDWVVRLSKAIIRGYQLGTHFPIASDSYEQLVALKFGQALPKEKLMELSTIIPMIADWYAIFDLKDEYPAFREAVTKVLSSTNLQYWFPDEMTENHLYACNAGYASGVTVSSINLAENVENHRLLVARLLEKYQYFKEMSCLMYGFPVLALISSRHFRTPVIPAFWQFDIPTSQSVEDTNVDDE